MSGDTERGRLQAEATACRDDVRRIVAGAHGEHFRVQFEAATEAYLSALLALEGLQAEPR